MEREKAIDKQKMKIIIVSASVLALLIATMVTVACLNMGKTPSAERGDDDDDGDAIGAFAENTVASSSVADSSAAFFRLSWS